MTGCQKSVGVVVVVKAACTFTSADGGLGRLIGQEGGFGSVESWVFNQETTGSSKISMK